MKSFANARRILALPGITISLSIGVGAALGCGAPPADESKIWSSSASTSLTVEVGDSIDAVAEEKLNRVALTQTGPGQIEAQSVVVVPGGYWVDTASTLTLVKDDSKSVSIYYRLARVPKGQPILGCDSPARLTFKLTGLASSLPDGGTWSATIRRLTIESALTEIEAATK
jgi:hypothetical protein